MKGTPTGTKTVKSVLTPPRPPFPLLQILTASPPPFDALSSMLSYLAELVVQLGAASREATAQQSHCKLLEQVEEEVAAGAGLGERRQREVFASAVGRGLRFLFHHLQVLKRDMANYHLGSLQRHLASSPSAALEYQANNFAARYGLADLAGDLAPAALSDLVRTKLPLAATWLAEVAQRRDHMCSAISTLLEADVSEASSATSAALAMRTGGRGLGEAGGFDATKKRTKPIPGRVLMWHSPATLVRLGLVHLVSEGLSSQSLPETLLLDAARLRGCEKAVNRLRIQATGYVQSPKWVSRV